MRVTLWGTRGSLASAGPETARYGGNTSCVEVRGAGDSVIVLDAGTGIRRLGAELPPGLSRVDILLTHLHLDHIQGLGFFAPLYSDSTEVHIWGPASTTLGLGARLRRYLSPPLFPIHLHEISGRIHLHEVATTEFAIGDFRVQSSLICHPGPTVGYRITDTGGSLCYLPDHEPALASADFPFAPEWTSGFELAAGCDLLIHDAQYTGLEYAGRIGWGHSAARDAVEFAALAGAKTFVPFHHDPGHGDEMLDDLMSEVTSLADQRFRVSPGQEGCTYVLGADSRPAGAVWR